MGVMRFRVPADYDVNFRDDLLRGYVTGQDRTPLPTRTNLRGDTLHFEREMNDSGAVYVPYKISGIGEMMSCTGSLMERAQSYDLSIELLRGKINQIRNQYAEWQIGGLHTSPELEQMTKQATHLLCLAIMDVSEDPQKADQIAHQGLAQAFKAADFLMSRYTSQVFAMRHARLPKFDTFLGCKLIQTPPEHLREVYRLAFNAVSARLAWRDIEATEGNYNWSQADELIEWARSNDMPVTAGPLLDLTRNGLPKWVLDSTRNDPVSLRSLLCDYVDTVVTRYRGKISRWTISTGSGGNYDLHLSEEEVIRLTASLADAAWQVDSNLEVYLGLSQPWGDYLTTSTFEYSPFVLADTLLRANMPFAGLELELIMGSGPRGNYTRDLLETSRMLDYYGLLGSPIHIVLGYPASKNPDPQADPAESAAGGSWLGFDETAQAHWAGAFATLALAKSYVTGVFWDHLSDSEPHRVPHGGLLCAEGRFRPAFDKFHELREKHLS